jgi:protein tyrosine phosphatase (PTP) superfamily phosphohydrolase (DUF442 family)
MRFRDSMSFASLALAAVVWAAPLPPGGPKPAFQPLPTHELENAYRLTDKVLAGAQPEGDKSFAALRDLGVKTIISVDGAKPDVETAHKYGLRYVHLPIGYDDVSPEEGRAIAKAIDEVEGPVYVHCHHGKHRSAAAVATACVMNGRLKPEQAESVLKTFGTGENYKGLWASALSAKPLPKAELDAVHVQYREAAPIPPLAEAMVEIDQTMDRIKLAEKAGWLKPPSHPDVDPPHEALQLMEKLRELGRTPEVRAHPEAFRKLLSDGEAGAQTLHESLREWSKHRAQTTPPQAVVSSMRAVTSSCTACHKSFRDESALAPAADKSAR